MSDDVVKLFARDPLKLSEQDIEQIIEKMRAMRHTFNTDAAAKPAAKPKKGNKAEGLDLDLDLGDL